MASVVQTILLCILPGCAPCPQAEPVQVMVLVILGTDQNDKVTDKLREIATELRKKDPLLKGFELYRTINPTMKLGESIEVELIGKTKMGITLGEKADEAGRYTLTIRPPKLDEVQYACTCGRFFPIFTNYYTQEKQRLIIAVMAKPCKKK
jgi:hypothetical protein